MSTVSHPIVLKHNTPDAFINCHHFHKPGGCKYGVYCHFQHIQDFCDEQGVLTTYDPRHICKGCQTVRCGYRTDDDGSVVEFMDYCKTCHKNFKEKTRSAKRFMRERSERRSAAADSGGTEGRSNSKKWRCREHKDERAKVIKETGEEYCVRCSKKYTSKKIRQCTTPGCITFTVKSECPQCRVVHSERTVRQCRVCDKQILPGDDHRCNSTW